MSGIIAIIRRCPSCGRRFEIRLVSKNVFDSADQNRKVQEGFKIPYAPGAGSKKTVVGIQVSVGEPVTVGVPVTDETTAIEYDYRCKHCGHEWSEVKYRKDTDEISGDYEGD